MAEGTRLAVARRRRANQEVETCLICWDPQELVILSCCGQTAHKECLIRAVNDYMKCPHCRCTLYRVSFVRVTDNET